MSDSHVRRRAKSVDSAAEACLAALAEVLSYRAALWSKRDLATWLAGPYRAATRPHEERITRKDDHRAPPSSQPPPAVDGMHLHLILQEARHKVRAILRDPAQSFDSEADVYLAKEYVIELGDESSGFWFVPVNRRRMRLDERILSLAVAYYLMRPEELEGARGGAIRTGVADRVQIM